MGKNKNVFVGLPTGKLRGKLWTRYVRKILIPDIDVAKPLAHRMNDAIVKATKSVSASKRIDEITQDGAEIVSRGRWHDWWDGVHPTPDKLELINNIVPDSQWWFKSQESQSLSIRYWTGGCNTFLGHPMHTLLYALDLWASSKDESTPAFLLIKKISDIWRPKADATHIDEAGGRIILRWYVLPADSDILDISIVNRFGLLEPSSIVTFMLWFGYTNIIQNKDRRIFLSWTFDLLAASLATAKIIQDFSADASIFLAGNNSDSSTLVRQLLLLKTPDITIPYGREIIKARIRVCNGGLDCGALIPPCDDWFVDLLIEACLLFKSELEIFGVSLDDMKLSSSSSNM